MGQFDEDKHRLPAGFKRVAYDADTQIYTFRDSDGKLYEGLPREEYGVMNPAKRYAVEAARPQAFGDPSLATDQTLVTPTSNLTSFNDFLPATAFAESPESSTSPTRTSRNSSFGSHERSKSSAATLDYMKEKASPALADLKRSITSGKRLGAVKGLTRFATMGSRRKSERDSDRSSVMSDQNTLLGDDEKSFAYEKYEKGSLKEEDEDELARSLPSVPPHLPARKDDAKGKQRVAEPA